MYRSVNLSCWLKSIVPKNNHVTLLKFKQSHLLDYNTIRLEVTIARKVLPGNVINS